MLRALALALGARHYGGKAMRGKGLAEGQRVQRPADAEAGGYRALKPPVQGF